MGTKVEPGQFDCYAKAEPDEPMFILLARDFYAPILVRLWARDRALQKGPFDPKVIEAKACADAMEEWNAAHFPKPKDPNEKTG